MGKINLPVSDAKTEEVTVDKMDTTIINKVDEVESKPVETSSPDDFELDNGFIRLLPLKRHFEIDATDTKFNKELEQLMEYAKEKGYKTRSELIGELKQIESKIGRLDEESTLHRVLLYIKLNRQAQESLKGMSKLEEERYAR